MTGHLEHEPILPASAHAPGLLTPALVVSAAGVDHNVETTLAILGHDPGRWRPHVKTAKLAWTMHRLLEHGIRSFKCATTLELATLARLGAEDVLLAMPLTESVAARAAGVAGAHPAMSVSGLVESVEGLRGWPRSLGVVIDVNVGMNRTGIDAGDVEGIATIARAARDHGLVLKGLHAYDGHLAMLPGEKRTTAVDAALERVAILTEALSGSGIAIESVVTSGSLTFADAARTDRLARTGARHQLSPGTVVYSDTTTAAHGGALPYRTAAHVLSRVVSAPAPGLVTCDAGHKAVSADAGVPTCAVVGRPGLVPQKPSEEHLPIAGEPELLPSVGDLVELAPRHVCPTVNLYDEAILVEADGATRLVAVDARGHEANLP